MRFCVLMFGFAFALTNCVGVADNEAVATPTPRVERPEWFRSAISESAHYLDSVGCEKAPLEVIFSDPLWYACIKETSYAAEAAQARVYADALDECVEWRGVEPQCCFARVTNESIYVFRRQRCEVECRERRIPGRKYRPAPKCESEVVAYPRDPMRARTPLVEAVIERCLRDEAEIAACKSLPTNVERSYCLGGCETEPGWFRSSLKECRRRIAAGLPALCEHLFADKPIVSAETMAKRKAECERACAGSIPPLE